MLLVEEYARIETAMLLDLHRQDKESYLFELSEQSSELIFDFQDYLEEHLAEILADLELTWAIIKAYTQKVLIETLGKDHIMTVLAADDLKPYRNAILTKKAASTAFYKYYASWDAYRKEAAGDLTTVLRKTMGDLE